MRLRASVSFLLLAAIISFFYVPHSNGQPLATTTTMTVPQPPLGQCSSISIPFTARKGEEITGIFGSDAIISFYILSQGDFIAIQNPDCRLPSSARPIFSYVNSLGSGNSYRTLPFPANGTYYFVFVYSTNGPYQLASGYATVRLTYPSSLTIIESVTSSTATSSNALQNTTTPLYTTTTLSTTSAGSQETTSLPPSPSFGLVEIVGIIVAIGLVTSVIVFKKRRTLISTMKPQAARKETGPELSSPTIEVPRQVVSTGYAELDAVLAGGLPTGRSILIESPPCDERDLLLRRIIKSGLSIGGSVFFLSRDVSRTQDLSSSFRWGFYAFTPQIDKITANSGNIFKISGIQNLVDLNVSFAKAIEPLPQGNSIKMMVVDFLSDVLFDHKAFTTRKWLDEFIARYRAEGFTVLATLNPHITYKQETETILDLFDGIIEIYEKEVGERARRFLTVKKMYGVKYAETELLLDKYKLF
jgi:KaiC/GvpD/RAD55 family RecA-like ATPase